MSRLFPWTRPTLSRWISDHMLMLLVLGAALVAVLFILGVVHDFSMAVWVQEHCYDTGDTRMVSRMGTSVVIIDGEAHTIMADRSVVEHRYVCDDNTALWR